MNLKRHTRVSQRRGGFTRRRSGERESRPAKARCQRSDGKRRTCSGHPQSPRRGRIFGLCGWTRRERISYWQSPGLTGLEIKQGSMNPDAPASVTSANWTLLPPGACCSAKNASSFSSGVSGVITASGSDGDFSPRACASRRRSVWDRNAPSYFLPRLNSLTGRSSPAAAAVDWDAASCWPVVVAGASPRKRALRGASRSTCPFSASGFRASIESQPRSSAREVVEWRGRMLRGERGWRE